MYSVNVLLFEGENIGFFYVYMGMSFDKVVEVKLGLENVLFKLVNEWVSEIELDCAKCYVIGVYDIGL